MAGKRKPSTNGHKPSSVQPQAVQELREQFLLEQAFPLDDGSDSIVVRINPTVARRAEEWLKVAAAKRGLKLSESIQARDSEVLSMLETQTAGDDTLTSLLYRGRAGKLKGRKDQDRLNDLATRAVDQVKARYADHENALRFIAYSYAMIADDVFQVVKNNGQIGIEARTDYPISEDYWEHGGGNIRDMQDERVEDPFDELLKQASPNAFEPIMDRSSTVELSFGITYEILRHNPLLASTLAELNMHLYGYLQVYDSNPREMDADSFRDLRLRLSSVLYVRDGASDQNGHGNESAAQLPPAAEADRSEPEPSSS